MNEQENKYKKAINEIERISEIAHKSYCEQYKIKHGKEYWTKGDYSLLDEETKEFDRATVRAVLQASKQEIQLEEGSIPITLKDVYVMFWVLVKQNQKQHPGSKMSFDLNIFKNLPKHIKVNFERSHGRLFAWIPGKANRKKKKSTLYLPKKKLITPV